MISVDYGNTKITQHALKVSVFKPLHLDIYERRYQKAFKDSYKLPEKHLHPTHVV